MADDKLAQKRNTGAEPVKAKPNHDREKTYEAPETPGPVREEKQKLPENTAREKVSEEMPGAADKIRKKAKQR